LRGKTIDLYTLLIDRLDIYAPDCGGFDSQVTLSAFFVPEPGQRR
jgi:hypothetical protein